MMIDDIDVLSASMDDNKISLYKNDGNQNFIEIIISNNCVKAYNAMAIDIDNDGDNDILSASGGDNKIAWHENIIQGCTNENSCNFNSNAELDDGSCVMIEDYNGDGDVNEDDILNIQDILIIITYILNEIELNLDACEANINNDFNIDIFDIIQIINFILN